MERLPDKAGLLTPVLVALAGVPSFVAFTIGGRPELGVAWASVSVAFALVLAVGGRSDTVKLARGSIDDERALELELKAATASIVVVTLALAGLFLAAGIRGENGVVYGALLILVELSRLATLAVLNRRS